MSVTWYWIDTFILAREKVVYVFNNISVKSGTYPFAKYYETRKGQQSTVVKVFICFEYSIGQNNIKLIRRNLTVSFSILSLGTQAIVCHALSSLDI